MAHWLVKSEPDTYSFDDLVREGRSRWDGVRNYQARNNLRTMQVGDLCLYYHSNIGLEVVGIARVAREHYPDPTAERATGRVWIWCRCGRWCALCRCPKSRPTRICKTLRWCETVGSR